MAGRVAAVNVNRVLLADPRGFCAGVEMAIKALTWMVRAFNRPIYCYHEIVHNKVVVERFEAHGEVFVAELEQVPEGVPLMLSAHGSAPEVVRRAGEIAGYQVDAVCPLVTKVHHEVRTRSEKGYQIVYVGHAGHEEAEEQGGGGRKGGGPSSPRPPQESQATQYSQPARHEAPSGPGPMDDDIPF